MVIKMKDHKAYTIGKCISYFMYSPIAFYRGLIGGWNEARTRSMDRFITD